MSKNLNLWDCLQEVNVEEFPSENIIKFAVVEEQLFIVTEKHNLFYGCIEIFDGEFLLRFNKSNYSCLDIDSSSKFLYIVDTNGFLYKCNKHLNVVEEIQLVTEDNEVCCHGFSRKYKTKVKKVSVNDYGGLFITIGDQLWAFGNMPQINVISDVPKKVDFFSNRKVYDISIGKDFAIVIVGAQNLDNENQDILSIIKDCSECDYNFNSITPNFVIADKLDIDNINTRQETSDCSCNSSNSSNDKKTLETYEVLKSEDNNESTTKNVIFQNTEAAKNFLLKQFSWVSTTSEQYLDDDSQNKTLTENVTNVASFVYDKVKSVAKHLNNDLEDNECSSNISNDSLQLININDDLSCSLSVITCDSTSENGLKENFSFVLKNGADIIGREVWTWGNITYGQLGTGDKIKREHPMIITKLSNVGAVKCSAKSYHAAVLTLDGRAFLWGKNDQNQISVENDFDQSSPKKFSVSENEKILDVSCGFYHTNLLSTSGDLYYLNCRKKETDKPPIIYSEKLYREIIENLINLEDIELISVNEKGITNGKLFSAKDFTLLDKNYYKKDLNSIIVEECCFLEDLLIIYYNFIKPIHNKYYLHTTENVYEKLSGIYLELIYLTAYNLSSIYDLSYGKIHNFETIIIKHYEEFIIVYKNYFELLSDIISIDGLQFLTTLVEIPRSIFKTRVVQALGSNKINNFILVKTLLKYPKERFLVYEEIVHKLLSHEYSNLKSRILSKFTSIYENERESEAKAEMTKQFWNAYGKILEYLKTPSRKLIIESRKNPIFLQGGSRFSSRWFILLSDIFVYINGSTVNTYDLKIIWVEAVQNENDNEHKIILKMPEDFFVLVAQEYREKSKWLHALQDCIKKALGKENSVQVPTIRNAGYNFTKVGFFKNAKYLGRWSNAKMHGKGVLEWIDGRKYVGQMNNNAICGNGKMEIPNTGVYEGSWKENRQNGYGIFTYVNGDIYKGYFKDGLPHGHGCLQQGHFMSSNASVYIGEWINGNKNGYGVCDNITTGEKYLGKWQDNKKQGNGIIVTSDGVYYEGLFNQDLLVGNGLMILEDGTHYEGDFKGIGQFNGKGRLTLNSGHSIIGHLSGSLTDGLKINNGMLSILKPLQTEMCAVPKNFGKFCVPQDEKWIALFRHCHQILGINDFNTKTIVTQKIWRNVAIKLSNSYRNTVKKDKAALKNNSLNSLDVIPQFGMDRIDKNSFNDIKNYIAKAVENNHHPLHFLLNDLTAAYNTSYGGLRAYPLLLRHATFELHSILKRLYQIIVFMFPALPPYKEQTFLGNDDSDIASCQMLLHPIVLPQVYSSLFVLYTLHNTAQDYQYWKRLIEWNKQPDYSLMLFLSVDKRFLGLQSSEEFLSTSDKEKTFLEAIESLQLIKTTFSPFEKILVIRETFQKTTITVQNYLGNDYKWNMDDLFPVFMYIVVRARILQLGSEIHFIEDFFELNLDNGELGIMFTTLKACYQQILQEKATIN